MVLSRTHYNKIAVTAAILEKDGKILIARRKRGDHLAGKWEFPGGKLEENEIPEVCLRREMQEEFGIHVAVGRFVGLSHHVYPHEEVDLLAFRVTHISGDFDLHDHEEILWVRQADLKSYDFSAADLPIVSILQEYRQAGPGECLPVERFLRIDALQFRFLEWGSDRSRPLILLHGTGDSASTWDQMAQPLAEHFRVIALDQRGHGKSNWAVPPAYRCEHYLHDLSGLIDALRLDRVILVGHSMGALHASLYAAQCPGRVAALVHIDIESFPPDWNRKYLLGLYNNLPGSYSTPEEFVEEIARNAPYASRDSLRDLALRSLAWRNGRWHRIYDRETLSRFDHYDLRGGLSGIRCPSLVVRGAESRVLGREAAEQMVRALPAGEMAEIQRATHPVHLDNPDALRETVMGFLRRHGLL